LHILVIHVLRSLLYDEISEHFKVLSICLLIMHLIVVSHQPVKHVEVRYISQCNSRNSYGPSALDQFVTTSASVKESAGCHHSGNRSYESPETCLGLPNAESLMIIEKIWLLLNFVRFF